jgi:PAS domain S-box-containing protein
METTLTDAMPGDLRDLELRALEVAPVAILVVDGEGHVVFANERTGATFGCAPAALAGSSFDALLDPGSRAAWRDGLAATLAQRSGPSTALQLELRGVRGEESFPAEVALAPMSGSARTATVVVRDVAELRRREASDSAAVREAEATRTRLQALLTFAPAFILVVNREGTIDFINRTLPQYTLEDTIGSSWLRYFEPSRHAFMTETLKNVYETGANTSYEVRTPGPDGRLIYFEAHIAPMRVGGEVVGAVLVSQDVTERHVAQAEVLAGRHMALLGTLASGVAHEINTPIQFVGDSVHFLRNATNELLVLVEKLQSLRHAALAGTTSLDVVVAEAAKAEENADLPYLRTQMPQAFESCLNGLGRVTTIVRSLKDFAHPSEEAMVPADLNRAIRSGAAVAINEYKYVADLELDLGELPPVTCHVSEVGQAVVNMIVNAAHAIESVVTGTDQKGRIAVRSWRDGDAVMISIADTGAGIRESIRPRIFDPFFTTKEVGKGTGQGLAIARSAVEEHHGGSLTFETCVGKGTTFFIRLPIEPCVEAGGARLAPTRTTSGARSDV